MISGSEGCTQLWPVPPPPPPHVGEGVQKRGGRQNQLTEAPYEQGVRGKGR